MSQLWLALTDEQEFVSLGLHETFDNANNCAPGNTVWVLDKENALEWKNKLSNMTSGCAQSVNSWLCVDYAGQIRFVGEFHSIEEADQSLEFECVWLIHRDTALSWIQQLSLLMNDAPLVYA